MKNKWKIYENIRKNISENISENIRENVELKHKLKGENIYRIFNTLTIKYTTVLTHQ